MLHSDFLWHHLDLRSRVVLGNVLSQILHSVMVHPGDFPRYLLGPTSFLIFGYGFLARHRLSPLSCFIVDNFLFDGDVLDPAARGGLWRCRNDINIADAIVGKHGIVARRHLRIGEGVGDYDGRLGSGAVLGDVGDDSWSLDRVVSHHFCMLYEII